MENQTHIDIVKNRSPRFPVQDHEFLRGYSLAEKYFYIVLCWLIKQHGDASGKFVGHDVLKRAGVPSFDSFGLSQRICKSARKKLEASGLITCKHVYGEKGYRNGTEYALCEAAFRPDPKEIHALILNRRAPELSPYPEISPGLTVISP